MSSSYKYIDTREELDEAVARIAAFGDAAVDIEADSFHHYFEKVCLIQVAAGGEVWLVDPLAGVDMSGLLEVLGDKRLIFHDGGYDLRMMRSSFGFAPRGEVFDTMLAGQLAGYRELGLAAMIERSFDVKMVKTHQKANWSKRPLDERLLEYACDDVGYLERLAERLESELDGLGRRGWHRESCRWMVEATGVEKPAPAKERQWRIKGTRLLSERVLGFVRQIWLWREKEAQRADLPAFKVMVNQKLLELAEWACAHPDKPLDKAPRLPRNCVKGRLEGLRKAIEKASGLDKSMLPKMPTRTTKQVLDEDCKGVLERLKADTQAIADELGIEAFLVAPRATLAEVARRQPKTMEELMECGPMMRWQAELLLPVVESQTS